MMQDASGFMLSLLPVLLTLLWVWLQVCFDATREPDRQANPEHVRGFAALYVPFFVLFLAIILCAWAYTGGLFRHAQTESNWQTAVRIILGFIHLLAAWLAVQFFRRIRVLI